MNRVFGALRREWPAISILVCGALLRFYQLSEFPFHPDEAIHAWFPLDIGKYHYDPIYHGPLLYHLTAAVYAVLGASDFSARIVPAVSGVLLLWLVMFPTRRYIGERAALWSGILLAFSPVIVAYSRRLLHDSLVLILTLGAVLCFQVALENGASTPAGRNARLSLAAILALFLATKANVFFIAAMLAAFWIWNFLSHRNETKTRFDAQTPLLCGAFAVAIFVLLFRSDSLRAFPAMIEYWSGQQRVPRLPGPSDYYLRLGLLYELPLLLAALCGAWRALTRRNSFSDLLMWWALTSLVIYAVANEKVPWLLSHQMLPLALLGGWGLAQIEINNPAKRVAFACAVLASAIFSLRHIVATNIEAAADRHEPLLFAQTPQKYRDTLMESLHQTRLQPARGVWVWGDQWPEAWYLRRNSPLLEVSNQQFSPVFWNPDAPDETLLRVVIASPEKWQSLQRDGRFRNWNGVVVERYVWPRPAWSALAPKTWARFWWARDASIASGVLQEESSALSVIAVAPNAGK